MYIYKAKCYQKVHVLLSKVEFAINNLANHVHCMYMYIYCDINLQSKRDSKSSLLLSVEFNSSSH